MHALAVAAVLWGLLLAGGAGHGEETDKPAIVVFGAASLTNVLQDLGDAFTKQTSVPVKFSVAASSALARQIENGRPRLDGLSPEAQSDSGCVTTRCRGQPLGSDRTER
jgi:ABC-type molybdate transport system substrate-binding protein